MIIIDDINKCCGCSACVQVCTKQCISFNEDRQGFRYPIVDVSKCINCGLCEKVCPCLNPNESRIPQKVFAAINPDEEIRMKSSSGGIFTTLAESTISEGGVVFGARFNEKWEVVHSYTETIQGLDVFRGSKYVQSVIGTSYIDAQRFLKSGRRVLFSGTPCQIAGLKSFLRKEYENLLTVDVVCHGVPSPLVWRTYLNETMKKIRAKRVDGKNTVLSDVSLKEMPVITGISFRDKTNGWEKYGFVIQGRSACKADKNSVLPSINSEILLREMFEDNVYMQLFLKNLSLRPSCYACLSKKGRSSSDISLCDFWGIPNKYSNTFHSIDKGVSAVLVYSAEGERFLSSLDKNLIVVSYKDVYKNNTALEKSCDFSSYVESFWNLYQTKGISGCVDLLHSMRPMFVVRVYNRIRYYLYNYKSKFCDLINH